jgi:ABC-type oligopeptide transport system substrate-binding subunit
MKNYFYMKIILPIFILAFALVLSSCGGSGSGSSTNEPTLSYTGGTLPNGV